MVQMNTSEEQHMEDQHMFFVELDNGRCSARLGDFTHKNHLVGSWGPE